MKVCVQGLWHLGSVLSAALVSWGHEVAGLDFDAEAVESLSRGDPPLFEPGLEDLIKSGLRSGRLRYTVSVQDAVHDADVLWVAYDTPVDEDDNPDVAFVIAQIERVLGHLRPGTTVLVSSQLPVGSTARLEAFAATHPAHGPLAFAYVPENLRLGRALENFLHPDRIVVGTRPGARRDLLERLLQPVNGRIEWMTVESAEMTKHALNAFLATSAAFANEIATLCEATGADAREVERGLKTDQRIGPRAYLAPGAAFAGGTLARDIRLLNRVAAEKQLATPLLAAVKPSNDAHKQWARRHLQRLFPDLAQKVVAIWGLTYKPGTDTLRRSGSVELCEWLLSKGATLRVHDPAVRELPSHWAGRVDRFEDPLAAVERASALVVATQWPLYREIPAARVLERAYPLTVLDADGFVRAYAGQQGLRYMAVGQPVYRA